jgi:sialate O-acetylesterase
MIAPLLNYTIKGTIWYQGESNTGDTLDYHQLFSSMITDWRQQWGEGNFPFLFVQLPNYGDIQKQPTLESGWAAIRSAQLRTLSLPNTGMAVSIDVGEWNDLHPLDKEDVGKRLALAAEHIAYGDDKIVYSSPICQSMKVEGNKMILTFDHTGTGLMTKNKGALKCFSIEGQDGKLLWAVAKIIAPDKVMVWNDLITHPVMVQYAWSDSPDDPNLYDKEGLPASPFRMKIKE